MAKSKNVNADGDFTKPGEALRKIDADAHAATYDESGDLLIKSVKPVAEVQAISRGTADTGVDAKIQEPVAPATLTPADTVEQVREDIDHEPETVEVRDEAKTDLKDGDESLSAQNDDKLKEAAAKELGVDKTEAGKKSDESVKDAKKLEKKRESK